MKEMILRLRLAELLKSRGMTQAQLARETGLSEDRVSRLVHNAWLKVTKREIGLLLHALRTTPAELFEVYEPSVFYGATCDRCLSVHVSSRSPIPNGHDHLDHALFPLTFNARDIEAFRLVHDHTRDLEIDARFELHHPASINAEGFQKLVESGTHVIIGSNVTGALSEYAFAYMYRAPAFDRSCLDRFPFNFSWGENRSLESSFGFDGEKRGLVEGIYSVQEKKIVATRTRRTSGAVLDCGVIGVYRIESPPNGDPRGIRRERCVIVLAGHGRHGTLGCARLLVDPAYQERLYPEKAEWPKMFVVQVELDREPPEHAPAGHSVSRVNEVQIVAEA